MHRARLSEVPELQVQTGGRAQSDVSPDRKHWCLGYRFPYDDGCFDLVVVASVFTHMLSPDTERYLREISRVLKQGGQCFVSFYLLDDEARRNICAGISAFDFKGVVNGCRVQREDAPEKAVAYEEDRVRALFGQSNLPITAVLRGQWSSTKAQLQDIVIASRMS